MSRIALPRGAGRGSRLMAAALAMLAMPGMAAGTIASTTLAELAQRADVIVVGRDEAVEQVGDYSVARFSVDRVIKGAPGQFVHYLATPTWVCDTAQAQPGQWALLFLVRPPAETPAATLIHRLEGGRVPSIYQISHAGRGRMPIPEGTLSTVVVWVNDVRLPEGIPTAVGPDPEYSFIRSVPLAPILEDINQALRKTSQVSSD